MAEYIMAQANGRKIPKEDMIQNEVHDLWKRK